ncbi:lamin-like protein isoform X2 [Sipha flava]|uniref:Lamin-like protein isoform X2 n=1 Tax=Sipha flava TaxID=143950 RepID=A0A8B8FUI8_9HEMI|nr:lamin-like protein isoform X2 [Sipha flava]
MESKLCRQQNTMNSLAKPKHKTVLPEKQNTWSNLLNKKTNTSNTAIAFNKKSKKNSLISENNPKTISQSVQCDLSNIKQYQSSSSLSVFNPIRTLQFLLKEITHLPNTQNSDVTKIVDEMQVVVGRIINEFSKNEPHSKFNIMPVMNDSSMIPTKDNDFCKDLKYENNTQENKYWIVLLEKISELENNYSQLSKNYMKSEEKLQSVISERDKLLEKFQESCHSLEKFNNREREYLDTITELKSKLMVSEKLINQQETIITNLNKMSNSPIRNKEFVNENMPIQNHSYEAELKENNELRKNYIMTKLNLDKSKINNSFKKNEVSKLRSDIKQIKNIVLTGIENTDIKPESMISLKSEGQPMKDFSKFNEDNKKNIEHNIDLQYTEYNRQAAAIKSAKSELQQLLETIKIQAYHSKKMFNSTVIDDISDEEDDCSNVSNFMSIATDSSVN